MKTLFSALALGGLLACGGVGATSPDVGGACHSDRDCTSRCTTHEDFGRGMCTASCQSDNDCPEGSICAEKDGGICAVSCATDRDCEDFGRAFVCKDIRRKSGGEALVCRVP